MRFALENEIPIVSVCIITYKHEDYIATAIESVLMQETNFTCEVIIGEDCSSDKTREILKSYGEKFPLKLLLHEKNLGAMKNWDSVLRAANGKYIAFFEGDDSWIDPLKLQKQFNALERNPEAVLCYTNSKIFDTQNPDMNIYFTDKNRPSVFKDKYQTICSCPMATNTIFFRNVLKSFPDWALKVHAGDYIVIALLAKWGGIYYLDEVCGLHNHHYHGLSRTIPLENFYFNDSPLQQNLVSFHDNDPKVYEAVLERTIGTIDKLFHMKQFKKAKQLFWKWDLKKALQSKKYRMQLIKLGIKIHFLSYLSKGRTYR